MVLGMAPILAKTVTSIPNKVYRFVFLFLLFLPLSLVIDYVYVRLLGYHKMGWIGLSIMGLLFAILGTFFPPQPHNSNTP